MICDTIGIPINLFKGTATKIKSSKDNPSKLANILKTLKLLMVQGLKKSKIRSTNKRGKGPGNSKK